MDVDGYSARAEAPADDLARRDYRRFSTTAQTSVWRLVALPSLAIWATELEPP